MAVNNRVPILFITKVEDKLEQKYPIMNKISNSKCKIDIIVHTEHNPQAFRIYYFMNQKNKLKLTY